MKIKKIRKLNEQEMTVDIEVENTHTYQMSNGMVSHNTVSQLVNSASGLHARHSEYYIRRVRVSKRDPICQFLIDSGVTHHAEVGQGNMDACSTVVFDFPIKAPSKRSVFRDEKSAIQQLEHWKILQTAWCEHKPSMTVNVKDDEWLTVGGWVYQNWDIVSGVSFMPHDGGIYQLVPYQSITKDEYLELVKVFPKDLDFTKLTEYEKEDYTIGASEMACSANGCELI